MFANFCESRIRVRTILEHSEALFFDESIAAKINRSKFSNKVKTPFINDRDNSEIMPYFCDSLPTKDDNGRKFSTFPNFSYEQLESIGLCFAKPPIFNESDNIVMTERSVAQNTAIQSA